MVKTDLDNIWSIFNPTLSMNYQSLHFEHSMSRRSPLWGFLVKLGLGQKMVLFKFLTKKLEQIIWVLVWTNKKTKASKFLHLIRMKRLFQVENLCYFWLKMRTNLMWTYICAETRFILEQDFKLQCPTLQLDGKCHGDKYFRSNNIFLPWLGGRDQQAIVSQFNV